MPPKIFYKKKAYPAKTTNKNSSASNSLVSTSAQYLVIVESPSKCKKIEEYLGNQYACIASKGHIRHIDNLKSIDTKRNFHTTFSIIDEKKEHVSYMQSIINQFQKQHIILATDDDREGEAIAWHICQVFDLPVETTSRIIFHEITKSAILQAIQTPATINMNIVYAQQARQVLDMIVGFKISPLLWKYIYNNKSSGLSAGRCQTPALRLVYDNEKERLEKGGLELKYKTVGRFFSKNSLFDLNHDFSESDKMVAFLEKTKTFAHELTVGQPKESIRSTPKPFNTSRLLQTASNVLHLSPKDTMSLCQQLYQAGHITYMRTDSVKYAGTFLEQARKYIMDEFTDQRYVGDFTKLENTDKNNPHEAIRVTHIEQSSVSCTDSRMGTMYRMIWRNTIESCMSDAKYNNVLVKLSAPDEHAYNYTLEIPVFLGWKRAVEKSGDNTDEQNVQTGLQQFFLAASKSGKPIPYNSIECTVSAQHKHRHYGEATLIQKLEDLGIGRPSTFATIVDTIQERGYVKNMNLEGEKIMCLEYKLSNNNSNVLEHIQKEKVFGNEKNKLVIQPTGILTIEFLLLHFQKLFSYDYTKNMEDDLDQISNKISNQISNQISDPLATTSSNVGPVARCAVETGAILARHENLSVQNESVDNGLRLDSSCEPWYAICRRCYDEIVALVKPVANVSKRTYRIDAEHDLVFHQYGASLKRVDLDGQVEYKSVKSDVPLDLDKLERGEYSLDDLVEIKDDYLGKYLDEDVYIKTGRYGPYVEWGAKKESIKRISKPLDEISLADVIVILEAKHGPILTNSAAEPRLPPPPTQNASILRVLSSNMSVRKGKFGAYVYYKRPDMKNPEFYNIKKFSQGFAVCDAQVLVDWVKTTYNVVG
jgi:DNA topoisomerase-1